MKATLHLKGGEGSGNFDHAGRPGLVGGSSFAGGNPYKDPIPKDKLKQFVKEGMRLSVKDYELGNTTLIITKVTDNQRVHFSLADHSAPTGFQTFINSVDSFLEYLENSEARRHSGSYA